MNRHKQFRVRDLIWLMLLSALAVSWWTDHRRLVAAESKALAQPAVLQKRIVKLQGDTMQLRLIYARERSVRQTLQAQLDQLNEQLALAAKTNAPDSK